MEKYSNITLKGLNEELEYNSNNLAQNLKEKSLMDASIKTLETAFKSSNNDIYIIRANEIKWELTFIDKIILECNNNINTLNEVIKNYKEPKFSNKYEII